MRRRVDVAAPATPLWVAAHRMKSHNVALLPVCEGRKVVGVITWRDITMRATAQGRDPRHDIVQEVMMVPPVCAGEEQDLEDAAGLMQRWQLGSLPVVDRQMRLVGIVALSDVSTARQNKARKTRIGH